MDGKTLQAPTIDGESMVLTWGPSPAQQVWLTGAAKQRAALSLPSLDGPAHPLGGAGQEKFSSPDLASGPGFFQPIALSLVSLLRLALDCSSGPRLHLGQQLLTHAGGPPSQSAWAET